jgi:hypothetical protein
MQVLRWLDHLPGETLEGGIERANELLWAITVHHHEGRWWVKAGEDTIFVTDSRESSDAFLYGLGLAYGVLPDHIFEQLKQAVKDIAE